MFLLVLVLLDALVLYEVNCEKKPKPYNQTNPQAHIDNPNFIRDRYKNLILKPQLPDSWFNRDSKPFNPAWMDFCDPYHCNDYHKPACGLNRNSMRFKWFQSQCHIIMNNECATFRGAMKYDIIEAKFCEVMVMDLRDGEGCPDFCDDEVVPVCGISTITNHAVLFRNRCTLDMVSCRATVEEYEEVQMAVCDYYLRHKDN